MVLTLAPQHPTMHVRGPTYIHTCIHTKIPYLPTYLPTNSFPSQPAGVLNLTHGSLLPSYWPGPLSAILSPANQALPGARNGLNVTAGLRLQYGWLQEKWFTSYAQVKSQVEGDYDAQVGR